MEDNKSQWSFHGIKACFIAFEVEVSPLENAIQVVENKNQELRTLISQYQHKQMHGNINLLSMCLNGVIDAAVNGGIARYQEVSQALLPNSLSLFFHLISISVSKRTWLHKIFSCAWYSCALLLCTNAHIDTYQQEDPKVELAYHTEVDVVGSGVSQELN